jgi:hypothetical protein
MTQPHHSTVRSTVKSKARVKRRTAASESKFPKADEVRDTAPGATGTSPLDEDVEKAAGGATKAKKSAKRRNATSGGVGQ